MENLTLNQKLVLIQSELKAPKNQFNSFGKYKYRSQEDILEALKPLLKQYDVSLTIEDEIKQISDLIYVEATVLIESGSDSKSIKAQAGIDPKRKGMDIAQCFGASSSYARKYALNGMFLIDDTKDPDATNGANPEPQVEKSKRKQKEELTVESPKWNTVVEAIKNGYTIEQVKSKYTVSQAVENALKKVSMVNKAINPQEEPQQEQETNQELFN